jgi:hypothetical protein
MENTASNSFSVACVSIAANMYLVCRSLAMATSTHSTIQASYLYATVVLRSMYSCISIVCYFISVHDPQSSVEPLQVAIG